MSGNDEKPEPTKYTLLETPEQIRQNKLRRALLSRRENYRMFRIGVVLGIAGNVFVSTALELIKTRMEGYLISGAWSDTLKLLFILSFLATVIILWEFSSIIRDINTQIQTYLPPLPGTEE